MTTKDDRNFDFGSSTKSLSTAWMLNFCDLLTVLLSFFILIYAISQADAGKMEEIKKSLNQHFGGVEQEQLSEYIEMSIKKGVSSKNVLDLDYLFGILENQIKAHSEFKFIRVSEEDDKIVVSINDKELFQENSAELTMKAYSVLYFLSENFLGIGNKIKVISENYENSSKDLVKLNYLRAIKVAEELKDSGYIYNIDVYRKFYKIHTLQVKDKTRQNKGINDITIYIEQNEAEELNKV